MIRLVLAATATHLATGDTALCGADVRGKPTLPLEPGADFGDAPHDCKTCVAERKREARK